MVILALDAMGGDHAPSIIVEAVAGAHKKHPHVIFKVFGDEQKLQSLLNLHGLKTGERILVVPTTEVIGPEVKPSAAIRGYRQSSMYQAIKAVAAGEAQGVISAGNTGAYMALAMLTFRTVANIARPAIATLLPTQKGETVMLDLGANVACDAENLVQFAVMGSVLASLTCSLPHPTVGILNVGSEDLKGHEIVKEAAQILRATKNINFYGFVEGDDIGRGTVDVVVTDGFTGNVALKTTEGTARMLAAFAREAFTSSWLAKLGYLFARKAIQKLKNRLDPRYHNGAIFIGLNHVAVKSHGGTDAIGFINAIEVTLNIIQNNLNKQIVTEVEKLTQAREKAS